MFARLHAVTRLRGRATRISQKMRPAFPQAFFSVLYWFSTPWAFCYSRSREFALGEYDPQLLARLTEESVAHIFFGIGASAFLRGCRGCLSAADSFSTCSCSVFSSASMVVFWVIKSLIRSSLSNLVLLQAQGFATYLKPWLVDGEASTRLLGVRDDRGEDLEAKAIWIFRIH
jgi:hypothetical protein